VDYPKGWALCRHVPVDYLDARFTFHCGHADLVRECIDGRAGQ
jgi:hypothetical protein